MVVNTEKSESSDGAEDYYKIDINNHIVRWIHYTGDTPGGYE